MIWTIVLWLGMQAQAPTSGLVRYPTDPVAMVEGREHVFEIRTKRHWTGRTKYCYPAHGIEKERCGYKPREELYCPNGARCSSEERVTRELWIDNQRIGVIKGLE